MLLRWAPPALLTVALVVAYNLGSLHDSSPHPATALSLSPPPALADAAALRAGAAGSRPPPAPAAMRPPPAPASSPPPSPAVAEASAACAEQAQTEMAGDVVRWGDGHVTPSWQACCAACAAHVGPPLNATPACNVWVFCSPERPACAGARAGQCWLKRQALVEGLAAGVMASGPAVGWSSGVLPRYSPAPSAAELGLELRPIDPATAVASPPARARECGSPAVDGYSHVVPSCLEQSATARQFNASEAARLAQVAWLEVGASYDGLAVAWGIGHKKASAAACADACRRHVPDPPSGPARHGGQFGKLPCNAFVWCPAGAARCFEPDAHTHTGGDCWLKFTEAPENVEVNSRGAMEDPATARDGVPYRKRHAAAEARVPWVSGVLLPPGHTPGNGTWGPRARW